MSKISIELSTGDTLQPGKGERMADGSFRAMPGNMVEREHAASLIRHNGTQVTSTLDGQSYSGILLSKQNTLTGEVRFTLK
jgi:hypothetical protein